LILNFDLNRSLRRIKPSWQVAQLTRRPDELLPFISGESESGPGLLLDACVYVDILRRRTSAAVEAMLPKRTINHSAIALSELTHLLGRLDPRDLRSKEVLAEVRGLIVDMPARRLSAPSVSAMGEAGILAGVAARLGGIERGREQSLLNDAMLYLKAFESGLIAFTRNIREFDWFDQLLPNGRVLFYRQA
jgi:predicted nucleic acid-binding protein